MTEQELNTRGSKRNIGEELIKSLKELSAGIYGRKTTFEFQPNGDVRRVIVRADGSVEKDEMLHGSRWKILAARTTSGLSQSAFASALPPPPLSPLPPYPSLSPSPLFPSPSGPRCGRAGAWAPLRRRYRPGLAYFCYVDLRCVGWPSRGDRREE